MTDSEKIEELKELVLRQSNTYVLWYPATTLQEVALQEALQSLADIIVREP